MNGVTLRVLDKGLIIGARPPQVVIIKNDCNRAARSAMHSDYCTQHRHRFTSLQKFVVRVRYSGFRSIT